MSRDIGGMQKMVLHALGETAANRRQLAEKTGLEKEQVSRALNRLEAMGLIDIPAVIGGAWTINSKGRDWLDGKNDSIPDADPANTVTDAAIEPLGDQGNPPDECLMDDSAISRESPAKKDRIAEDLLTAMEIEVALEYVRTHLLTVSIPARTQRVYREVVNALPPVLVDALAPITEWVNAQGLLS